MDEMTGLKMKVRQIGVYDGRQSKELNDTLKSIYETATPDTIKEKMNELRKVLGINNFITVSKHLTEDLYIVRVFDAIADDVTIGKLMSDEIGCYFEIDL